jgi:thiamine-phosphate pyrophosphorylase
VVETISLPIIVIGGVAADNIRHVMRTGAHGIAVISAVCCQDDPEQATRSLYQALYESAL